MAIMKDLKYLDSVFRLEVEELISQCSVENVCMVPYNTLRTPIQQAKYWRQSRTTAEIVQAIEMLKKEGAVWLADILHEVGPQYGRKVTSALPGLSWHQWGEAIDCFSLIGGKANWDSHHMDYNIYARIAEHLGLHPGHYWRDPDSVHVQKRKSAVLDFYSLKEINQIMADRFNRRA